MIVYRPLRTSDSICRTTLQSAGSSRTSDLNSITRPLTASSPCRASTDCAVRSAVTERGSRTSPTPSRSTLSAVKGWSAPRQKELTGPSQDRTLELVTASVMKNDVGLGQELSEIHVLLDSNMRWLRTEPGRVEIAPDRHHRPSLRLFERKQYPLKEAAGLSVELRSGRGYNQPTRARSDPFGGCHPPVLKGTGEPGARMSGANGITNRSPRWGIGRSSPRAIRRRSSAPAICSSLTNTPRRSQKQPRPESLRELQHPLRRSPTRHIRGRLHPAGVPPLLPRIQEQRDLRSGRQLLLPPRRDQPSAAARCRYWLVCGRRAMTLVSQCFEERDLRQEITGTTHKRTEMHGPTARTLLINPWAWDMPSAGIGPGVDLTDTIEAKRAWWVETALKPTGGRDEQVSSTCAMFGDWQLLRNVPGRSALQSRINE
mgnify:CR=1 FL=1